MTYRLRLLLLMVPALGACASAPPSKAPAAASPKPAAPATLQAAIAPAKIELRPFTVRALEGRFTAEVSAISAPKIDTALDRDGDATSVIEIDVGARSPIYCTVTGDLRDPGAVVAASFAKLDASFPEMRVELAQHAPLAWFASRGTVDGAPAAVHAAILPREGGTLFCLQAGEGTGDAFHATVTHFVDSARHEGWTRSPFTEVALLRVGRDVRGFAHRYVHEGARTTEYATYFVQKGERWGGLDSGSVTTFDARGEMQTQTNIAAVNGAVLGRADIKRGRGRQYTYEVTSPDEQTKRGSFTATSPVTTELSRAALVRAFVAGKDKQRTFLGTHEGDGGVELRKVVMRRTGGRAVAIAYGAKKTSTCDVAPDGLCVREDIVDEDGEKRTWERLYVEGSP